MSQEPGSEGVPEMSRRWQEYVRPGSGRRATSATAIDVSVCIANWNCCRMLKECLESLLDQDQGVNVEVIVVDNASADGAADMAAALFPEVILHRNAANLGFSRANNQAAALAHGRYLFFLNNDTVVHAGVLRGLLAYAEAHPEVGMIGPRLRDGEGNVQKSYRQRLTLAAMLHHVGFIRWTGLLRAAHRHYRRDEFDPDTTRPVESLMGAALFLRRDLFEECGRWDEDFVFGGEDVELSVRVGRRHPLIFLPSVEITHYGRVSSRQHSGYVTANMAAGHIRYLRKVGYSGLAVWFYKLAVTLDLPMQVALKAMDYLAHRLFGQVAKAHKRRVRLQGLWHLLILQMVTLWRQ
jgi:N-acetylglucosaminyl-diphospho-decaprenol L-rhamnosyltransferase